MTVLLFCCAAVSLLLGLIFQVRLEVLVGEMEFADRVMFSAPWLLSAVQFVALAGITSSVAAVRDQLDELNETRE